MEIKIINFEKDKPCGIYLITDMVMKKNYVGQTINFAQRMRYHWHYGSTTSQIDKELKKRPNDFVVEVLATCEETDIVKRHEKLNELEKYYIKLYYSYNNGYNCTKGGSGFSANKTTCRPVVQYNYDYSEIINTFDSCSEAAIFLGVSVAAICDTCKGKSFNQSQCHHCLRYGFLYQDEQSEELSKRQNIYNDTKIVLYHLDKNKIPFDLTPMYYWQQSDIKNDFDVNSSSLCEVLQGKRKYLKNQKDEYFVVYKESNDCINEILQEQILKVEKDNTIQYYNNSNECGKILGYQHQTIQRHANNHKPLDGIIISYITKREVYEELYLEEKKDA